MRVWSVILAGSLAAALGCGGITTVSQLPATVSVRFGQEFRVEEPNLTIQFVEVVQDSRCPVAVNCVQPGSATLRFSISRGDGGVLPLHLATDQPPAVSEGISFRLVNLEPLPRVGTVIDPRDYQATLELTVPAS